MEIRDSAASNKDKVLQGNARSIQHSTDAQSTPADCDFIAPEHASSMIVQYHAASTPSRIFDEAFDCPIEGWDDIGSCVACMQYYCARRLGDATKSKTSCARSPIDVVACSATSRVRHSNVSKELVDPFRSVSCQSAMAFCPFCGKGTEEELENERRGTVEWAFPAGPHLLDAPPHHPPPSSPRTASSKGGQRRPRRLWGREALPGDRHARRQYSRSPSTPTRRAAPSSCPPRTSRALPQLKRSRPSHSTLTAPSSCPLRTSCALPRSGAGQAALYVPGAARGGAALVRRGHLGAGVAHVQDGYRPGESYFLLPSSCAPFFPLLPSPRVLIHPLLHFINSHSETARRPTPSSDFRPPSDAAALSALVTDLLRGLLAKDRHARPGGGACVFRRNRLDRAQHQVLGAVRPPPGHGVKFAAGANPKPEPEFIYASPAFSKRPPGPVKAFVLRVTRALGSNGGKTDDSKKTATRLCQVRPTVYQVPLVAGSASTLNEKAIDASLSASSSPKVFPAPPPRTSSKVGSASQDKRKSSIKALKLSKKSTSVSVHKGSTSVWMRVKEWYGRRNCAAVKTYAWREVDLTAC
ncbi:hypothetical protein B0H11DRAFT_1912152 [Mycena galericulata]|nr:hypothetical protein B0H11DRAFT_1912152 [Mycena galericulata]